MHRLATVHNVTDRRRQTDRRNTVPIARPLVRSSKKRPNSSHLATLPGTTCKEHEEHVLLTVDICNVSLTELNCQSLTDWFSL